MREVLLVGEEGQAQHGRLQPFSVLLGLELLQVELVCLLRGRSGQWKAVVIVKTRK